jgi:hypothetical protein
MATGVPMARACIFPSETADVIANKTWVGQAGGWLDGAGPEVYIAGKAADLLADDEFEGSDDHEIADVLEGLLGAPDEISATDAAGLPSEDDGQLGEAIHTALGLLRQHWRFFQWAIAQLEDGEVITDGMAKEKWDALDVG